ncbi:MAG: hypothetical protein ACLGH8_02985 [Bacteroidia bacterium]
MKFSTLILLSFFLIVSCRRRHYYSVPSGTYRGTVYEVHPGEKELFLKTSADTIIRLFFTDRTVLTKGNEPERFDGLKVGNKIDVQIETQGTSMKPISVKVLE